MGAILWKMEVKIFSKVTVKILIDILKGSLPYGLLGVLGLLYFKVDAILLSYLKGSYETGIYGAGFKFLEAVVFIPSAISTALFPVLAKLHEESIVKVRRLYFKSLGIFVGISLVILVAYLLILPWFIATFLPQYLQSIEVIRILSFSLPFMFAHSPGVLVLLSTDRYLKPIIALSFVTLGFNLIANLIFIPKYGFIGSAYITVFSEILSFIIFFLLLRLKVFKE
jgi:O-antigen/teichoic acid export membrane protein